ncbi:hypothetical protein [Roseococcus pinisoli]|uniref:Uncharacterized protein n=1 Tax=Roseococcus pinisoli TaxID=2835040 RepID=A0ABS5QIH4_9PROT|nr:hypothetical protein [Roseococcus pinisoli]MBS7813298.1 hypothetical protein [Roseococcus pinisoli]
MNTEANSGPFDDVGEIEALIQAEGRRLLALAAVAGWITDRRILLGLLRRPGVRRVALLQQQAITEGGGDNLIPEEFGHWLCRRRTLLGLLRRSPATGRRIILGHLPHLDLPRRTVARPELAARLRRQSTEVTQHPAEATERNRLLEEDIQRLSVSLEDLRLRFDTLALAKIADEEEIQQLSASLEGLRFRFDALELAKIADEAELLEFRIRFAAARKAEDRADG